MVCSFPLPPNSPCQFFFEYYIWPSHGAPTRKPPAFVPSNIIVVFPRQVPSHQLEIEYHLGDPAGKRFASVGGTGWPEHNHDVNSRRAYYFFLYCGKVLPLPLRTPRCYFTFYVVVSKSKVIFSSPHDGRMYLSLHSCGLVRSRRTFCRALPVATVCVQQPVTPTVNTESEQPEQQLKAAAIAPSIASTTESVSDI